MGFRPRSLAPSKDDRPGRLLLFSGGHRASVEQSSSQHQDYVTKYPNRLSDVAYTLAKRREHLHLRSFCVTRGAAPFHTTAPVKCPGLTRSTFVFTGRGRSGSTWVKNYYTSRQCLQKALEGWTQSSIP